VRTRPLLEGCAGGAVETPGPGLEARGAVPVEAGGAVPVEAAGLEARGAVPVEAGGAVPVEAAGLEARGSSRGPPTLVEPASC